MEHMTAAEVAITAGLFVGSAIAAYVVGARKGRKKAILDGAPSVFGESFLRRAEAQFRTSNEHAQMLQAHELKIAAVTASVLKVEAQFALAEVKISNELKELREMGAKIREDIASLRGAIGFERRQGPRPSNAT